MKAIALASVVSRTESLMEADIDGDLVIMSPVSGKYYCTGDVGVTIWEHLRKPISVSSLCEILVNDFIVTRSTCESEVFRFLGELYKEGLIDVK